MRWGILRNTTWYTGKNVDIIILACSLIHNLIHMHMATDPSKHLLRDDTGDSEENDIGIVDNNDAWTTFRNNLANEMYDAHL